MIISWLLLLTSVTCLQYIPILQTLDFSLDTIHNWRVSTASFADDSPFEAVKLPFSFLFYDHRQTHVWISPNGYLSFAPGVPCDCCYNGLNCGIETQHYQALAGGYVTDLNPLHSNISSISYGWTNNTFVVWWENVPFYGESSSLLDFQIILHHDGSIQFNYNKIILPMPQPYYQEGGFVGIRPFYSQGNYTRRSPILSSNQNIWGTSLEGNYALYQDLYTISNDLNSQKEEKQTSLHFCLMPTEFCLTPFEVSTESIQVTATYSIIACGNLSSLHFRCVFNNYTATALLHPESNTLTCIKPTFSSINSTISVQIQFSIGNTGNWKEIPTVTPLTLQYHSSVSPVSPFCNMNEDSCSICGVCSNTTVCIGEDNVIFGDDFTDCPSGQSMDRGGNCCSVDQMDCKGYCYGSYIEALDSSTGTYPVCCLNTTVDCHGVCEGTATIDSCGICSNGFTGHRANSDVDCLGICFGNKTSECDISLITSTTSIQLLFHIDQDETSTSSIFFINNTSPYFGKLISYPQIINSYPPTLSYSLYLMNGTDSHYSFIPFNPEQGLFPGYARIAVVLSSSIQALVKTPQQYERSYHKRQLKFNFQSMIPSTNETMEFQFSVYFVTRGCGVITNTRGCNLLPGCYGCLLNMEYVQYPNYFGKSYAISRIQEFTYRNQGIPHYFTCVDVEKELSSQAICTNAVIEARDIQSTLNKESFFTILSDSYMFFVYAFLLVIACFIVYDVRVLVKARKFELELWELYLNDYNEYRTIVSTLQQEEEEEEVEEEENVNE